MQGSGIVRLETIELKRFVVASDFEDAAGSVDLIVFPEAYRRLSEQIKLDLPVLIKGNVRIEEGANPKLAVSQITALEDAKPKLPRNLRIRVPLDSAADTTIDALHRLCSERKGDAKVLFDLERAGAFLVVMEAESYNVVPDRSFINRVEELCGKGSVRTID